MLRELLEPSDSIKKKLGWLHKLILLTLHATVQLFPEVHCGTNPLVRSSSYLAIMLMRVWMFTLAIRLWIVVIRPVIPMSLSFSFRDADIDEETRRGVGRTVSTLRGRSVSQSVSPSQPNRSSHDGGVMCC